MFNRNYPSVFDSFLSNESDLFKSLLKEFNNTLNLTVGETKTESGVYEDGNKWYKTTFTSKDGSYTQSVYSSTPLVGNTWSPKGKTKTTPTDSTPTNSIVDELKKSLETAIETQNFEDAVKFRDEIKSYEKNVDEVNNLKSKLDMAVSTQNYEDAIKWRDKINKLTNK
jgi:excinuclease UvrABC helicase subunit UvrB